MDLCPKCHGGEIYAPNCPTCGGNGWVSVGSGPAHEPARKVVNTLVGDEPSLPKKGCPVKTLKVKMTDEERRRDEARRLKLKVAQSRAEDYRKKKRESQKERRNVRRSGGPGADRSAANKASPKPAELRLSREEQSRHQVQNNQLKEQLAKLSGIAPSSDATPAADQKASAIRAPGQQRPEPKRVEQKAAPGAARKERPAPQKNEPSADKRTSTKKTEPKVAKRHNGTSSGLSPDIERRLDEKAKKIAERHKRTAKVYYKSTEEAEKPSKSEGRFSAVPTKVMGGVSHDFPGDERDMPDDERQRSGAFEPRHQEEDAGRYYGHSFREATGQFGSLPSYDDHDE